MTQFKKQEVPNSETLMAYIASVKHDAGIRLGDDPAFHFRKLMAIGCDFGTFDYMGHALDWRRARAPFLNVYPTVAECLQNTPLTIDPGAIPRSVIHALGSIEIRTPSSSKLPPFFIHIDERTWADGEIAGCLFVAFLQEDTSILYGRHKFGRELFLTPHDHSELSLDGSDERLLNAVTRVALGVLLLASDERYCEPILLSRDRGRSLNEEARKRAVERARQRGVIGFDLGKHIEVSPHFRRPHFAIRWTGQGRRVPRLVPVKGSIINRKLLGQVPTGYDEEE